MGTEPHSAPPSVRPPKPTKRRGPAHLIWALPLALAVALIITVVAGITACGVSGCSGGGFGPATHLQPLAAILVVFAGAVLGAPLLLIGWTSQRRFRLAVALVVALAWAVWVGMTIAQEVRSAGFPLAWLSHSECRHLSRRTLCMT